jgi:preprotein translocase subunit SecF
MNLLANAKIDFMRLAWVSVPVSALLLVVSVVLLSIVGLNLGIDFAGGTQLVVKFAEEPEIDRIRDLFAAEGFDDPPRIQRFGQASDNEVIIKTRLEDDADADARNRVIGSLQRYYNPDAAALDLNQQGAAALSSFLLERDVDNERVLGDSEARQHYDEVAALIMEVRRQEGLIRSWEEVEGLDGVSDEVVSALRSGAQLGGFSVLRSDNVGPQIGGETARRGVLAMVFSLVGMLAYIWIRFELRFGLGALVALMHDVVIALGFFVVLDYEADLTTIAAFLTLIGYSVNDSVVIFDRLRENLRRSRRQSLVEVINLSLNQTLSRTLLTSGTTMMALATMFFFGGDVLRGFSFVLLVGVFVGTYSSVFVASPMVLLWGRLSRRKA